MPLRGLSKEKERTQEEILAKLIESASKVYMKDADTLSGETSIPNDLGTKSLDVMGMTAMIENDFDVVVPLAEYGHYATLNDLAKMIAEEQ